MKNKALLTLIIAAFLLASAISSNSQDSVILETGSTLNVLDYIPLYISDISTNSVAYNSSHVIWTTNKLADSTVRYGVNLSLDENTSSSNYSSSHDVALAELESSRLYFYNVTSCDLSSNCTTEGIFNFTTSAVPAVLPKGGGGGGGGGTEAVPCKSSWYCDLWPRCENGKRTRMCDDLAGCSPSRTEEETCAVEEKPAPVLELPTPSEVSVKLESYAGLAGQVFVKYRTVLIISLSLLVVSALVFFLFSKVIIKPVKLDEKLLNYVRNARKHGFNNKDIAERLRKEGMKEKEIKKYLKHKNKEKSK